MTSDLYQVHRPANDVPLEDYWGTMLEFKGKGKVRHVGLSNHGVAALERAETGGHVEILQPLFSMIRRDTAAEILPSCRAHGTGVICYSPMQPGLLTGSFTRERAEALRPIAAKHNTSVASIALAWAGPSLGSAEQSSAPVPLLR